MRTNTCIAVAILATSFCTPTAEAQQAVRGQGDTIPGSYVVVLKDGAQTSPQTLLGRYHSKLKRTYKAALNGFSVQDMTEQQARRLAADPTVAYVQRSKRLSAQETQWGAAWNLDRLDQAALPLDRAYTYPNTAANVTTYVLDSGIRTTHQEFEGRASNGWDFIDDDPIAQDCVGHGTHVAGTIAGRTYGVAKKANVVGVRVLACDRFSKGNSVIDGIDWITEHGVRPAVVNMSLGGVGDDDWALEQAISRSIAAGFTYVLAAGNSGADACTFSPARLDEAITVGAVDVNGDRSIWPGGNSSNHGRCVDIWAPGSDIRSASHTSNVLTRLDGGTSMAAPHVAGAAALYLSAHPDATHLQVRNALVNSATPDRLRGLQPASPNRLLQIRG